LNSKEEASNYRKSLTIYRFFCLKPNWRSKKYKKDNFKGSNLNNKRLSCGKRWNRCSKPSL